MNNRQFAAALLMLTGGAIALFVLFLAIDAYLIGGVS